MRHIIPTLIAVLAIVLAGCESDQPRAATTQVVIPPAAPTVSPASETIIAQRAQAQATQRADQAMERTATAEAKAAQAAEKSARTEQDRAAALAQYQEAMAKLEAAKADEAKQRGIAEASTKEALAQRDAQIQGQTDRFYCLACLLVLGAVFLLKEGNTKGASLCGALAATCFVLPSIIRGILAHEQLIFWGIAIGGLAVLAYHYRAKERVLIGKLEIKAVALEHVMATGIKDVDAWVHTVHPVAAVETELKTVWQKVLAEARAAAAKLHLIGSANATQSAPTSPPAPGKVG